MLEKDVFSTIRTIAVAAAISVTPLVAYAAPVVSFEALNVAGLNANGPSPDGPIGGLTPNAQSNFNIFSNVGLNSGCCRNPWQGSIHDGSDYGNVGANGFVEFVFDKVQTSVSLLWGSPDTYNDLVVSFDGSSETVNGSAVFGTQGVLASLVTISNVSFTTLRLESGSPAFEFANLKTTPVPLPAALPLLAGGIGFLGYVGWRRRKTA